jgi:hypothetical protein
MKKKSAKRYIVLGIIILFIGASVIPNISGIRIKSIEDNERAYVFDDMNFVKNPLGRGVIFEDDFDTGNTPGEDPVGWDVTEFIDSEVSITGETYVSSPYSVKLYNPPDSGINLWHGFSSLTDGIVECYVRASADGCFISTTNEGDNWGILVIFWNGGRIMYLDPTGYKDLDPPFTYTPNTWYHFRFEFDCGTDTYDIYIDDDLKKQDALMRFSSTFFKEIWISCEYDYVCTGYVDNVKISEINHPPNTPDTPPGPTTLEIGESGIYTTKTIDPDGDQVFYLWNWGDGNISDWMGPYASGATINTTHIWSTAGIYEVKVQAKDTNNEESDWSTPLVVTITIPQSPNLTIEQFKGGIGLSAVVKNTGDAPATNVTWSILLDGVIFLGKNSTGNIPSIAPGGTVKIKTGFILGLGKTNIIVTTTCAEGATSTKSGTAFILFFFVLRVSEVNH